MERRVARTYGKEVIFCYFIGIQMLSTYLYIFRELLCVRSFSLIRIISHRFSFLPFRFDECRCCLDCFNSYEVCALVSDLDFVSHCPLYRAVRSTKLRDVEIGSLTSPKHSAALIDFEGGLFRQLCEWTSPATFPSILRFGFSQ